MNGDEKPHEHANCVHVESAHRNRTDRVLLIDDTPSNRVGVAAALAGVLAASSTMLVDPDGQIAAPPVPYEKPKTFKARRRGPAKGLFAMMVDLGATPPPVPTPSPDHLDPTLNTNMCFKCRMSLFGGAGGVMTAERCSWCGEFRCGNCDAEHDGVDWHPNHTGDIHCIYYEDP